VGTPRTGSDCEDSNPCSLLNESRTSAARTLSEERADFVFSSSFPAIAGDCFASLAMTPSSLNETLTPASSLVRGVGDLAVRGHARFSDRAGVPAVHARKDGDLTVRTRARSGDRHDRGVSI